MGFAIADLQDDNIWALFVLPEYQKMGIGKRLHQLMLNWYFANQKEKVWLSTAPGPEQKLFIPSKGGQEQAI